MTRALAAGVLLLPTLTARAEPQVRSNVRSRLTRNLIPDELLTDVQSWLADYRAEHAHGSAPPVSR